MARSHLAALDALEGAGVSRRRPTRCIRRRWFRGCRTTSLLGSTSVPERGLCRLLQRRPIFAQIDPGPVNIDDGKMVWQQPEPHMTTSLEDVRGRSGHGARARVRRARRL